MLAEAIEKATTTPLDAYEKGVQARFTRINDRWGVKLYRTEWMRDKTYRLQDLANSIECAPALGEKFEVTLPDGSTYYGYITECITKTVLQTFLDANGVDREDYHWSLSEDSLYMRLAEEMDNDTQYSDLCRDLKSIGIWCDDMHAANVGYLSNGRLVAIDFSHEEERDNDESGSY